MAATEGSWLERTREEALEPALRICDPHHHLWERPANRYLLDELRSDTGGGHRVDLTVFVECRSMYRKGGPEAARPVGETEFVRGIADESARGAPGGEARIAGIVGFADLARGKGVEPVLREHLAAGGQRFRGIRHACAWDESPEIRNSHTNPPRGLLGDEKFREGFACLARHGLCFDAWLYHTQLTELTDLARAFPEVTIILDHVGGPLGIGPYAGRRQEVFEDWRRDIHALAACPNVVVKLGGLGMPICGFGWHEREAPPTSSELADATAPYYLYCIEEFGPDRCMFESNFPVDKVSYSYTVLWNSFKKLTRDRSTQERQALFHDTAVRVYRL